MDKNCQEKTCKECKYYEPYDGPMIDNRPVIMFCPKFKENHPKSKGYSCDTRICYPSCFEQKENPPEPEKPKELKTPQIKKENKMLIRRTKHLYRMAGTAWLVYGHVLVIAFLYPWLLTGLKWANAGLFRLARFIPFPDVERVVDGETIMVPLALDAGDVEHIAGVWSLALVAAAVVTATIYALHRFSNFWWGRNHE